MNSMKTTISLPDPLFVSADRMARQLGISRSALFQRALGSFVVRSKETVITERLNAVYQGHRGRGRLEPLLKSMQTMSIREERW